MTLFDNPFARIREFIDIGGPVVLLLLLLSVVSVAMILFKLWQFGSLRLGTRKGVHSIEMLAVRLKRQHAGGDLPRTDLEDVIAVNANAQIKKLQRGFRVLDTIAQIGARDARTGRRTQRLNLKSCHGTIRSRSPNHR